MNDLMIKRKQWPRNVGYVLLAYLLLLGLYYPGFGAEVYLDSYKAFDLEPIRNFTFASVFKNRWLVNLSFYLDSTLWGEKASVFRIVNIAIHLLNGVLLYRLLDLCFRARRLRRLKLTCPSIALFISTLWLLHPIHYSVNLYLIQRYESVASTFGILGLYFFVLSSLKKNSFYLLLFIAALGLGFLCKMSVIGVPLAGLVITRILFGRGIAWYWRSYRYIVILSVICFCLLLGWRTRWGGLFLGGGTVGFDIAVTPWQYMLIQSEVIFLYIRDLIYPFDYVFDVYWREPDINVGTYLSFVFLMLTLLACIYLAWTKRNVYAGLLLAGYLILMPTSSFIPVADFYFHHRVYLASFCIICVFSMLVCESKLFHKPHCLKIIGLSFLLIYSARTLHRSFEWGDKYIIYAESLDENPCHTRALMALADDALDKENDAKVLEYIQRVMLCSEEDFYKKQLEVASHMLIAIGKTEYAVQVSEDVFRRLYSREAGANLIKVYYAYGYVNKLLKFGHKYLELYPNEILVRRYMVLTLIRIGEFDEARAILNRSVSLPHEDMQAMKRFLVTQLGGGIATPLSQMNNAFEAYLFGYYYYNQGKYNEAAMHLSRSLELQPGYRDSMLLLARLFIQSGQSLDSARELIDTVINSDKEEKIDVLSVLLLYWHRMGNTEKVYYLENAIIDLIKRKKLVAGIDPNTKTLHFRLLPELRKLN